MQISFPNGWMTTGDHDIANNLKLPDNVKQNVDEIMKTINQSINNLTENLRYLYRR